jgi:hypothetical protein
MASGDSDRKPLTEEEQSDLDHMKEHDYARGESREILGTLEKINRRLERLEFQAFARGGPSGGQIPDAEVHGQVPPVSGRHGYDTTDIQREYECIKDSLNKIKLPNEIRLLESKTGIKRNDQPHLQSVTKGARYTETCLKLISTFDTRVDKTDLQQLYNVLVAQINFFQTEYAALVVKGQFDQTTASLFKCLEKNTPALSGTSLDNLKTAAEIAAAASRSRPGGEQSYRQYQQRNSYNRGYNFNRRGRFNSYSGQSYSGRNNNDHSIPTSPQSFDKDD